MGRICCSCRAEEKARWTAMGRSFDFITKRNPRKRNRDAWAARTDAPAPSWKFAQVRKLGLLSLNVKRPGTKAEKRHFRLVGTVTEHTIDKKGQRLFGAGDRELQGRWTSLMFRRKMSLICIKHHTERMSSSIPRSDRSGSGAPASGKFDTNDAIVHLASFGDNCLRLFRAIGIDRGDCADPPPGQASAS